LFTILKGLIQNPLIISSVAGIVYSAFFDTIPKVLLSSFQAIGQLTLPAALLAIGATLVKSPITANLSRAIAASVIKVFIAPLFGVLAVFAIGLDKQDALVPIVLLACPTAIAAFIISNKLGPKPELTTAIIVVSTILSIISLSIVLAIY
jgi:predicted permease